MKNKDILNIGKLLFWISFILGNICLFGYILAKNWIFADYGFMLLTFGSMFNLFVIACLLVYGFFNKNQLKTCMKASMIMCINIPVAIIYFYIGISLLNL
jgi:LIVCS family branched-chain amino acid:cation transporter